MKPVVMMSVYFPPSGSVSAKRPARFVRHLPAAGWRPIVLTLDASAGGGVDPEPPPLPPDAIVERTYAAGPLWAVWRRWEAHKARLRGQSGAAAPADPRVARLLETVADLTFDVAPLDHFAPYIPGAARRAAALARAHGARAIFATGRPFSTLVAGVLAGREARLPVVLDLRDPWTLDLNYFPRKPAPLRALETRLERWCFARAARILVNTERARQAYLAAQPELAPRLFSLPNGFDRALYRPGPPERHEGFTLVHFGHFAHHRRLTTLLKVLGRVSSARLVVYGQLRAEDQAEAVRLGVADRVVTRVPVPHADALRVLGGAPLLLLIQGAGSDVMIPAKLYDYLCAGRPILALTTNPDVADLLAATGAGSCVHPDDEAAIAGALEGLRAAGFQPPAPALLEPWSAESQTRVLAEHLDAVAGA